MVSFRQIYIVIVLFFSTSGLYAQYNTAKPWAYWWWPGSAVDSTGIQYNLAKYAKAGFGGLHIIPIYGVKGEEQNFIPFLSKQWLGMVEYTCAEAKKQGLGIDLTLGTGWPFGGPQVAEADAAKKFEIYYQNGKAALRYKNTGQKVKRAAPGAEGLVLDHFSKQATQNYLKPFAEAFTGKNYSFRALYNDSYEVYGANWTDNFLEKFKEYRAYDLQPHLAVLDTVKIAKTDYEKRIWHDYNETLSDLMVREFNPTWAGFVKSIGKISRNEAHGSPANLLDLYAQNDIPESEFFGSKAYDIPGYRQDPDYSPERYGTPGFEVLKLASSPAHITGKKLVSSETATWLANHFKVSLAQIKPIIDESFLGGINHIFYHGATYTPPRASWPGWLFYASTNFNYNSHFWNELPLLNQYIERVQSKLQNTKPYNELLVYFPIHDLWTQPGPNDKTHFTNVHNILTTGMFKGPWGKLLKDLRNAGYSFDLISDAQLAACQYKNGRLYSSGGSPYKALIVPEMDFLPLATLQKIAAFKKQGLPVLFQNKLPDKVAHYANFEANQKVFEQERLALIGLHTSHIQGSLEQIGIMPEAMASKNLLFIRKKNNQGSFYFIANQSKTAFEGKLNLQANDPYFVVTNPLNALQYQAGKAALEIALLPGESIMLQGQKDKTKSVPPYHKFVAAQRITLNDTWQLDFLEGQPSLPASQKLSSFGSWTTLPDSAAQYFSGKARYSSHFDLPGSLLQKAATLQLGDVRESASVYINGTYLGTAWCLPYNLHIPKGLLKSTNSIEIIVQNLSANRIKYLDRQKVPWKNFYDINIVDINYKAFDASNWPSQPSGLLNSPQLVFSAK